jgi:hypothetical protein
LTTRSVSSRLRASGFWQKTAMSRRSAGRRDHQAVDRAIEQVVERLGRARVWHQGMRSIQRGLILIP